MQLSVLIFNIMSVAALLSVAEGSANTVRAGDEGATTIHGGEQEIRYLKKKKNNKNNKNNKEKIKSAKKSKTSIDLDEIAFDVRLQEGAESSLFEQGPIKVSVYCDSEVGLEVEVSNVSGDDAIAIFGSSDEMGGDFSEIVAAGASTVFELWYVETEGINVDVGAVGTSTGDYIGLDGDNAIGLYDSNAANLAAFGDNVNCVFMGTFKKFFNEPGDVVMNTL